MPVTKREQEEYNKKLLEAKKDEAYASAPVETISDAETMLRMWALGGDYVLKTVADTLHAVDPTGKSQIYEEATGINLDKEKEEINRHAYGGKVSDAADMMSVVTPAATAALATVPIVEASTGVLVDVATAGAENILTDLMMGNLRKDKAVSNVDVDKEKVGTSFIDGALFGAPVSIVARSIPSSKPKDITPTETSPENNVPNVYMDEETGSSFTNSTKTPDAEGRNKEEKQYRLKPVEKYAKANLGEDVTSVKVSDYLGSTGTKLDDYTIEIKPVKGKKELSGYTDTEAKKIVLEVSDDVIKNNQDAIKHIALDHELQHAYDFEYGLKSFGSDLGKTENLIDLSVQLYKSDDEFRKMIDSSPVKKDFQGAAKYYETLNNILKQTLDGQVSKDMYSVLKNRALYSTEPSELSSYLNFLEHSDRITPNSQQLLLGKYLQSANPLEQEYLDSIMNQMLDAGKHNDITFNKKAIADYMGESMDTLKPKMDDISGGKYAYDKNTIKEELKYRELFNRKNKIINGTKEDIIDIIEEENLRSIKEQIERILESTKQDSKLGTSMVRDLEKSSEEFSRFIRSEDLPDNIITMYRKQLAEEIDQEIKKLNLQTGSKKSPNKKGLNTYKLEEPVKEVKNESKSIPKPKPKPKPKREKRKTVPEQVKEEMSKRKIEEKELKEQVGETIADNTVAPKAAPKGAKPKSEYDKYFDKPSNTFKEFSSSGMYVNNKTRVKPNMDFKHSIEAYIHESVHGIVQDLFLDKIARIARKMKIKKGSVNNVYVKNKNISDILKLEEDITYQATLKALSKLDDEVLDRLGLNKADFKYKIKEIDSSLEPIVDEIVKIIEEASKSKGNTLYQILHGTEEGYLKSAFRTLNNQDGRFDKVAKYIEDMLKDGSRLKEIYLNLLSNNYGGKIQKLIDTAEGYKQRIATTSFEAGEQLAQIIKDKIKDKALRIETTKSILKKDYSSISDLKSMAEVNKFISKTFPTYKSISKEIITLAKSMSDEKYMNNINWFPNAEAILKHANKPYNYQDIINVDRLISAMAMNSHDFAVINKLKSSGQLDFILQLEQKRKAFAKAAFKDAELLMHKGYVREIFNEPHEIKYSEKLLSPKEGWAKIGKNLYARRAYANKYASGLTPAKMDESVKGSVLMQTNKETSPGDIIARARELGFSVMYDAQGKAIRARLIASRDVRENLLKENLDFGDVYGAELADSISKTKIRDSFIPAFKKKFIDTEDNIIVSKDRYNILPKEERDKLVPIPDAIKNNLPYDLKNQIDYVNANYKEQLLGDYEAITNVTGTRAEALAHKVLKEVNSIFKDNVITKNPVVWVNNILLNNVYLAMEGVSPLNILKYQKQAISELKEAQNLMKEYYTAFANGATPDVLNNIRTKLENNQAYILQKNGMSHSILAEIANEVHPHGIIDTKVNKAIEHLFSSNSDKAKHILANIYLTRQSYLGKKAMSVINYSDYMAKSTLVRHYMQQGKSLKEAVRLASGKFVNFDKILPRELRYLKEYPLMPFISWTARTTPTLIKTMIDKPMTSLAVIAGVYGMYEYAGKDTPVGHYVGGVRAEGLNPLSVITSPYDMIVMSPTKQILSGDVPEVMYMPAVYDKILHGKNPIITTR